MRVILQQNRRLVRACHKDVFLAQVIRRNLVPAVVPQPCQLAARMLDLIISLEQIVRRLQLRWDDEVVARWIQRPDIRSEDHDSETDLGFTVTLRHTFPELVCEVLAKTDVCK